MSSAQRPHQQKPPPLAEWDTPRQQKQSITLGLDIRNILINVNHIHMHTHTHTHIHTHYVCESLGISTETIERENVV